MNREIEKPLRTLGRLKVSGDFKSSVLTSVISVQAEQLRSRERSAGLPPRPFPGICGRQIQDLEPIGFSSPPRHAQPVVEGHYVFGGTSHE